MSLINNSYLTNDDEYDLFNVNPTFFPLLQPLPLATIRQLLILVLGVAIRFLATP